MSAGTLAVATGGTIDGAALTFGTTAGTLFHVDGGSFKGTTSTVSAGITGFRLSSGSATFTGALNAQDLATGAYALINVQGGSLSAASVSVGRSSLAVLAEPAAGATNSGFVVDGAETVVGITGNLSVSGSNSTANARMDGGTVTVGGTSTIGLNNGGRWSVLDVNGATFTLNNTATGVQLGNGSAGNAIFIVQDGGVANVGKFTFNAAGSDGYAEIVKVNGGTLYVGAGGMVRTGANALCVSTLKLQGASTLGASANWTSAINTTLTDTPIIKAANASDVAQNISLSGIIDGTGDLTKTGAGVLTLTGINTYSGATHVNAGTLNIEGDNSGATGTVTVASTATLGGNGNIGGSVTIESTGRHALAVAATSGAQVTRVITGTLDLQAGNVLDLTSAGPVADGVYILATANGGILGSLGSFTLSGGLTGTPTVSGNNLILTVSSSAYASWASGFGLQDPWLGVDPALNGTPAADPDNDGIANELEFALGGNPTLSSNNVLPTLTVTATDFVYIFNRVDASEAEVTLAFQSGTTLAAGSWTPVAIGAVDSPGVVVVENGSAADTVTVTIAKGTNTKLFGRLQAVK